MINICTRWESSQMPPELEWRIWRQIKGAFNINNIYFSPILLNYPNHEWTREYNSIEECLSNIDNQKIFLEPDGEYTMFDFKPSNNFTLILGNTDHSNKKLIKSNDISIRLECPGVRCDLYGFGVVNTVLAYWHGIS